MTFKEPVLFLPRENISGPAGMALNCAPLPPPPPFKFMGTPLLVLGNAQQGRVQEFERGGQQFKVVCFPPKIKLKVKKGHHALRLSFIRILRISPSHQESFVHLSAEEGGRGSSGLSPPH